MRHGVVTSSSGSNNHSIDRHSRPVATIRRGQPDRDLKRLLRAMPRLASFELPTWRQDPTELYAGDAKMLKRWADVVSSAEKTDTVDTNLIVLVAELNQSARMCDDKAFLGFAAVTIQPEFLSGKPGAHLETILVTEDAVIPLLPNVLNDDLLLIKLYIILVSYSRHVYSSAINISFGSFCVRLGKG